MSSLIENKKNLELAQSILAEAAKARHEIDCAQRDIKKAQSRLSFLIVAANEMIKRDKINEH